MQVKIVVNGVLALSDFAEALAGCIQPGDIIYLHGNLGAGKTTFCKYFLRSIGFDGMVKSPTYALVEPYCVHGRHYYHFDLYRLTDPLELDTIGVEDYFRSDSVVLVEWPQKGKGILPEPTLTLNIDIIDDNTRNIILMTQEEKRFTIFSK
jgi:tRNA threonylcarbamoyladenosine biosynthesis protein TsaE